MPRTRRKVKNGGAAAGLSSQKETVGHEEYLEAKVLRLAGDILNGGDAANDDEQIKLAEDFSAAMIALADNEDKAQAPYGFAQLQAMLADAEISKKLLEFVESWASNAEGKYNVACATLTNNEGMVDIGELKSLDKAINAVVLLADGPEVAQTRAFAIEELIRVMARAKVGVSKGVDTLVTDDEFKLLCEAVKAYFSEANFQDYVVFVQDLSDAKSGEVTPLFEKPAAFQAEDDSRTSTRALQRREKERKGKEASQSSSPAASAAAAPANGTDDNAEIIAALNEAINGALNLVSEKKEYPETYSSCIENLVTAVRNADPLKDGDFKFKRDEAASTAFPDEDTNKALLTIISDAEKLLSTEEEKDTFRNRFMDLMGLPAAKIKEVRFGSVIEQQSSGPEERGTEEEHEIFPDNAVSDNASAVSGISTVSVAESGVDLTANIPTQENKNALAILFKANGERYAEQKGSTYKSQSVGRNKVLARVKSELYSNLLKPEHQRLINPLVPQCQLTQVGFDQIKQHCDGKYKRLAKGLGVQRDSDGTGKVKMEVSSAMVELAKKSGLDNAAVFSFEDNANLSEKSFNLIKAHLTDYQALAYHLKITESSVFTSNLALDELAFQYAAEGAKNFLRSLFEGRDNQLVALMDARQNPRFDHFFKNKSKSPTKTRALIENIVADLLGHDGATTARVKNARKDTELLNKVREVLPAEREWLEVTPVGGMRMNGSGGSSDA